MAYQAIETRFFGPTNRRGARVRAKCEAKFIYIHWNYALGVDGNHDAAARALAEKLDWRGAWFAGGGSDGSGNVYVNAHCPCFTVGS